MQTGLEAACSPSVFIFFTFSFSFSQSSVWSCYSSVHSFSFSFISFTLPFLWYLNNWILCDAELWSHLKDIPVFLSLSIQVLLRVSDWKHTRRMLGNVVQSIKLTDYKSTMADQRKLSLLCVESCLISVFLWCLYKTRRQTSIIASCKLSYIPASAWALARECCHEEWAGSESGHRSYFILFPCPPGISLVTALHNVHNCYPDDLKSPVLFKLWR